MYMRVAERSIGTFENTNDGVLCHVYCAPGNITREDETGTLSRTRAHPKFIYGDFSAYTQARVPQMRFCRRVNILDGGRVSYLRCIAQIAFGNAACPKDASMFSPRASACLHRVQRFAAYSARASRVFVHRCACACIHKQIAMDAQRAECRTRM